MAYSPNPPPRTRNGRPAMPFTRPSGDGPAASGRPTLRIVNMPPHGRTFIDDAQVSDGGAGWEGADYVYVNPPTGRSIRVESPGGESRVGIIAEGSLLGAGSEFDWATMTPVEVDATGPGTLRVFGAPHAQLRIDGMAGMPTGASGSGGATLYMLPAGDHTLRFVASDGFAFPDMRARITSGQTTQLTLVRPAAPALPPLGAGIGGAALAPGAVEVQAEPGWLIGVGAPGATLNPRVTIPASGRFLWPSLAAGEWVLGVRAPSGAQSQTPFTVLASMTTPLDVRGLFPAGTPTSATATLTINGIPGLVVALARADAPTAPLAPPSPIPASGTSGAVPVPPGNYILGVVNFGGALQTRPLTIAPGARVVANVNDYFPRAQLTVSGTPGLLVAIASVGSTTPLVPIAAIPASGALSIPWMEGRYDLGVSDGTRVVKRAIVVPPGGLAVDVRDWLPAVAGTPAVTPGNLTVTGTAGWMLTLTPAGATAFTNRLPILAGGAVAFPVPAGSYALKVEDGAGHADTRTIEVPAAGRTVDVSTWFVLPARNAQGPTVALPGTGTILLSDAPAGSVVQVEGAPAWTVDASGRPVAVDVPTGSPRVTVTPPGGAARTVSVGVRAGESTPVSFNAMPAPSPIITTTETVTPVAEMCGPIAQAPAWAPATACPGQTLTAPDGTRYSVALAPAGRTGVVLTQLKADGTPVVVPAGNEAGWSTTTKVLLAGGVVAAGVAAWWFYGRDDKESKTENPGKSKCSCKGH